MGLVVGFRVGVVVVFRVGLWWFWAKGWALDSSGFVQGFRFAFGGHHKAKQRPYKEARGLGVRSHQPKSQKVKSR